jgi:hypothetical protein
MRLAQKDLLEFCVNPSYSHTLNWPDDYWPRDPAPSDAQWNASIADFRADRAKLRGLVGDGSLDVFALVPTGQAGQTRLRAILLVIDHNAYHLGQLIAVEVRWESGSPPSATARQALVGAGSPYRLQTP